MNKVIMQKMKWRVKRWMMVIYDDIVRRSKMMLWRMMLRRKTDPKAGTHTLREPALWKCLWRFRRSHFIRKCAGKMLRPRLSPERRHTLCASLRSRNACQDFTRATSCGNLQGKCRGPAGSPKRDPHFVRACAIQIHINISQQTSEEPLYTEFYRKNGAAQNEPRMRTHKDFTRATLPYTEIYRKNAADQNRTADFVRACAVETHVKISQEPLYTEIYRKNAADQNRAADFVRACAVETHAKISQERLYTAI